VEIAVPVPRSTHVHTYKNPLKLRGTSFLFDAKAVVAHISCYCCCCFVFNWSAAFCFLFFLVTRYFFNLSVWWRNTRCILMLLKFELFFFSYLAYFRAVVSTVVSMGTIWLICCPRAALVVIIFFPSGIELFWQVKICVLLGRVPSTFSYQSRTKVTSF